VEDKIIKRGLTVTTSRGKEIVMAAKPALPRILYEIDGDGSLRIWCVKCSGACYVWPAADDGKLEGTAYWTTGGEVICVCCVGKHRLITLRRVTRHNDLPRDRALVWAKSYLATINDRTIRVTPTTHEQNIKAHSHYFTHPNASHS
jgi:hypothetical protein